jgi:hypothetical protein
MRHILRRKMKLAEVEADGDGGDGGGDDHVREEELTPPTTLAPSYPQSTDPKRRAVFGANFDRPRERQNTRHHYNMQHQPHSKPMRHMSTGTLSALADPKSELARFLLIQDNKTIQNITNEEGSADDGTTTSHASIHSRKSSFYSLALEPMEVRRERIVMMSEAYAIFGALFLSGTWVLYEWGSVFGYGGCDARYYDATTGRYGEGCSQVVHRLFELTMAISLTANLFLAMFACVLWLMSVLFSGSLRNWVYAARHMLTFCHLLLVFVLVSSMVGVGLAIYSNLSPHFPEVIIALMFFGAVVIAGTYYTSMLIGEEIPLEYYHFPTVSCKGNRLYLPLPYSLTNVNILFHQSINISGTNC